jgi:hypothetical protein
VPRPSYARDARIERFVQHDAGIAMCRWPKDKACHGEHQKPAG